MRAEGSYEIPRNEENANPEADLGVHPGTLTELLFNRKTGIQRKE